MSVRGRAWARRNADRGRAGRGFAQSRPPDDPEYAANGAEKHRGGSGQPKAGIEGRFGTLHWGSLRLDCTNSNSIDLPADAEDSPELGGEPACMASLVCPECGAVVGAGHRPDCPIVRVVPD